MVQQTLNSEAEGKSMTCLKSEIPGSSLSHCGLEGNSMFHLKPWDPRVFSWCKKKKLPTKVYMCRTGLCHHLKFTRQANPVLLGIMPPPTQNRYVQHWISRFTGVTVVSFQLLQSRDSEFSHSQSWYSQGYLLNCKTVCETGIFPRKERCSRFRHFLWIHDESKRTVKFLSMVSQ